MAEADGGRALVVRHEGRSWTLAPGRARVAGRGAFIDLGPDPAMHRRVAAFDEVAGRWFALNLLPHKRLTLAGRDRGGLAPRVVAPGDDIELPGGRLRLSFRIGADVRALDLDVPRPPTAVALREASASRSATRPAGLDVELSPVLRQLATALAELRLLDPSTTSPLPSKAEVCERLEWSEKKYDNTLDRLCGTLAAAGVEGVVGDDRRKAVQRREVAVDVLIENEVLSFADLILLPDL